MSSLLAKYLTTAALALHAMLGCCLHHAHGAAEQHSTVEHAGCGHHNEQSSEQGHGEDCDKAHCLTAMECPSRMGWNLDERLRDTTLATAAIAARPSTVSHCTDLLGESRFSDGSSTRLHLIQECFLL